MAPGLRSGCESQQLATLKHFQIKIKEVSYGNHNTTKTKER